MPLPESEQSCRGVVFLAFFFFFLILISIIKYKFTLFQVFYVGSNLNDNMWHNLFIKRRGAHLELFVDSERPVQSKIMTMYYQINLFVT
jgi:hypothetical protein